MGYLFNYTMFNIKMRGVMVMVSDLRTDIRGFESHKGIFLILYYFSHLRSDNAHLMKFPAFHTI